MSLNHKMIVLTAVSALSLNISCRKQESTDLRSKTVEKSEDDPKIDKSVVLESDFSASLGDARQVAFSSWANIYSLINFTKLNPKTQLFYQTTNPTDVKITIEPDRQEILWKFSNFQDSVAVTDVVAAVKKACVKEGYSSVKACIDDAISKSGAVVFELKQKIGSATNPNDENHIREALYGLMGATFINSPTPYGTTELRMTTSCIMCHNSAVSKTNGSVTTLFIDPRGDNSYADALAKRDALTSWTEFKNYVANPADPIWGISPETKAAGYISAQYLKLKDEYAHQYGYDENDIRTNAHRANIKSVVDAGWVSAFANWITTARPYSNNKPTGTPDEIVAKVTEKTTAKRILTERSNLVQPWSELAPLRAQRSVIFAPDWTLKYSEMPQANFALDYMDIQAEDGDPRKIALPYLLSATSISLVFPGVEDAVLSGAWYGAGVTPAQADQIVKRELPRTVMRGYERDAEMYHQARYTIPLPIPTTHVQTIDFSEVQLGSSLQHSTCFGCHSSTIADLHSTTDQYFTSFKDKCIGKAECFVTAPGNDQYSTGMGTQHTPSSIWANRVMSQMGTAPEAFTMKDYWGVNPKTDIVSRPSKIPMLRRQALGLWSYASYSDALLPNGQRPAAGYGVLSTKMSLDRSVPFRTVQLNFDFDGNGTIGQEKMYCAESKMYDLNSDGVAETACYDAIRLVSGSTPRQIGSGDAINSVHASVVNFPTTTANRTALAKLLAAYGDGAFNVRWANNTLTYVKLIPAVCAFSMTTYSMVCDERTWKGFEGIPAAPVTPPPPPSGSGNGSGSGS